MTTVKEIQNFYHRLLELKSEGYEIEVNTDNGKNYTAYHITKSSGTAKYDDFVIMYYGEKDEENEQLPEEIPAVELLDDVNGIVNKIDMLFK